jgi:hypothetical protein
MNEKKNQVENRWLLFAERYGYQPLPDVTNHELCKEFRDAIYDVVNLEIGEAIATLKNNRKTRLDYFKKNTNRHFLEGSKQNHPNPNPEKEEQRNYRRCKNRSEANWRFDC